MKPSLNNILAWTLAFAGILGFAGCYELSDTQEEWTGGKGETNYVGRLDSLSVRSGMNRVEIVGDTRYMRTAEKCVVSYDDITLDYSIKDIVDQNGKARMIVDNLEGGSYYFTLTTYDAHGNKSVPTKVHGIAYGQNDLLATTPKRVSSIIPKPDGSVDLVWNSAVSTYFVLSYESESGETITLTLDDDPKVTNVKSWKKGGAISVSTFLQKNKTDIDILELSPVETTFPDFIQESIPRFGQGSYMSMGASQDWDLTGSFTIEVRARYTELAGGDQCVVSCEAGGPDSGFMLRSSGTNLQFYIGAVNAGWQGVGWGSLNIGEWYDFAVTYKANTEIALYVNGSKVASGGCGTMAQSRSLLQAGTSPFYSSRYMRGDLQHISIWAQAKTPEEIKKDVEQGYDFSGEEEGLKAYWPLTVNFGDSLEDKTGKHTATFGNVNWNTVN